MDFEVIDTVGGDSVTIGDIIKEDGSFHQIRRFDEDGVEAITFDTYNLSTGDEDGVILDPNSDYDVYRSF